MLKLWQIFLISLNNIDEKRKSELIKNNNENHECNKNNESDEKNKSDNNNKIDEIVKSNENNEEGKNTFSYLNFSEELKNNDVINEVINLLHDKHERKIEKKYYMYNDEDLNDILIGKRYYQEKIEKICSDYLELIENTKNLMCNNFKNNTFECNEKYNQEFMSYQNNINQLEKDIKDINEEKEGEMKKNQKETIKSLEFIQNKINDNIENYEKVLKNV
eukprot:jgi/Orpsp1_1/1186873/evm.model.d7180000053816.1